MKLYPDMKYISKLAKEGYQLIPVWREIPSDLLTPVSAFLRLKKRNEKSEAFLLESAEGGERVGRFSFLGIRPIAKIYSEDSTLFFRDLENNESDSCPLSWKNIERYLSRWSAPIEPELPPFSGGAVGYVSYEASCLLEDIPLAKDTLGSPLVNFMVFNTVIVFDRLRHRIFLISHVKADHKSLKKAYQEAQTEISLLHEQLTDTNIQEESLVFPSVRIHAGDIKPKEASSETGQDKFCENVRHIKRHIRKGDIFQCVLSDRYRFPLKVDPIVVYRILRMINPSPYLYYLSFSDDTLLGSSPEMLLRCENRKLETCPIAGTRPRGLNPKQDEAYEASLRASVKECAEHLMLVDLGRNDLGRVSHPGSVSVKRFMEIERFSHVMHLVSLVEGRLDRRASPWEALGACFPAGTLSGAPKIRAMELIAQYELSRRGVYGGAIVAIDFAGNINSCITIRSLYEKNGYAYVQAGAGIVSDSRPQKEYEEIQNKSKAIRTAVALAEELL